VSYPDSRKRCGMARILASKNNLLKRGRVAFVRRNILEGAA
jgi:hypothetical protein